MNNCERQDDLSEVQNDSNSALNYEADRVQGIEDSTVLQSTIKDDDLSKNSDQMNILDVLATLNNSIGNSANTPNILDLLAAVVDIFPIKTIAAKPISKRESLPSSIKTSMDTSSDSHRVSCHRCGNIRKRKITCIHQHCPHIFCGRCVDKMLEEFGADLFQRGCPVCLELCCCSNKSLSCTRSHHCYRKCPASKVKSVSQLGKNSNIQLPTHQRIDVLSTKSDDKSRLVEALPFISDHNLLSSVISET